MTVALCFILASPLVVHGQDADCGPVTDVTIEQPGWIDRWLESTYRTIDDEFVGATRMMNTPPDGIPWNRLRFLDPVSKEPIRFEALARDDAGTPFIKDVVLEDPVLMVTWDQNVGNENSGGNLDWESYRPLGPGFLQEYVVNGTDGETNQWFTPHRNGSEYLKEQLGLDPACFNALESGDRGCTLAITQALATVGVYWAGAPLGEAEPAPNECRLVPGTYDPFADVDGHLWWRDRLLVFIADRSSFIRPSFNPTTTRDREDGPGTNDGVPRWNGSSYAFPTSEDPEDGNGPSYQAYLETVADFVGYIDQGDAGVVEYRSGPNPDGSFHDGFQAWHRAWRDYCWGVPVGSTTCPYWVWPFSGIGITVNWTQMPPKGPADYAGAYSAASEFISIGEKPIYLVAIRDAHQYLGSPPPESGGTTWCDLCPGDYDQNGFIDGADLATLLLNWNSENVCLTIDRTDPRVDGNDLARLLTNWGRFCEWPLDWRPEDCRR